MTPAEPAVGVIGPGRAGIGLALALSQAGRDVRLHGRHEKAVPAPLCLSVAPEDRVPPWIHDVGVVIFAVRDDAVRRIAEMLASEAAIENHQVVLHLSGCWGRELLEALDGAAAGLGSLHFLQTIADPETAPAHLRGAYAAVEGDARAVAVASDLAREIGLVPVSVASDRKPLYHAAAVFASNYVVVLAAAAERIAREAGFEGDQAWAALRPLLQGSLSNLLEAETPSAALTGPVFRGDDHTILAHVRRLGDRDRALYSLLGKYALNLAQDQGVSDDVLDRVRSVLTDDSRSVGS